MKESTLFFSINRLQPVLEYSSRIDFKIKNNLTIFLKAIKFRHPWLSPVMCSWNKDNIKLLTDRIFRAHANEGRTTREETCADKYHARKGSSRRCILLVSNQPKNDMKQIQRECVVLLGLWYHKLQEQLPRKHTIM